jgi:hypothetical protein
MAKYISNRQKNLKIGISSYTDNLQVVEVTGNVGIKTSNTQDYELYVAGDANISGIISATAYYGSGVNLTDLINSINISKIEGVEIKEEGVSIGTTFSSINFVGSGVTAIGFGSEATISFQQQVGPQGPQGYQGNQGTQGPQGYQGFQGDTGAQGPQGTQGVQGAQGPQGNQGAQGPQGNQGAQGPQGNQGTQGPQGYQGATGPVAGSANQVVYKDGSNNPTGSPNLTFNGTELVAHTLTVLNNTDINGNLNVDGSITIGGTSAQLNTQQLTVVDADIVLGIGTSFSPTDITASHGGIAIASTEGTPLVSLAIGGETNPDTYKKIMWFRGGDIGAGYTDAWLFNYGVGIGSTQVPNGVRLAAGGMQVTDTTLKISQLNISGVSTFTNGPVLIGTGTSTGTTSQPLQVSGGAYVSGNVGIGTTNSPDKLTVFGRIQIQQDSGSNNRLVLRGQPASSYRWSIDNFGSSNDLRIFREDDSTAANGSIAVSISTIGTLSATKFSGDGSLLTNLPTSSSQWVTTSVGIHTLSNVGIGTTNPLQKLEVVGGEIKAGRIDSSSEGGQLSFGRSTDNATGWYIDVYGNTSTPSLRFVDVSNAAVRAQIDGSGNFAFESPIKLNSTLKDIYNNVGTGSSVLISTGAGVSWANIQQVALQGPQGNQGAQGAQGAQGPQGNQGAQGAQGPQGNQGAQGAQGPQGNQGAQGAQGAQGPQGTQGVQGAQGAQGPQGNQGAQGPQGDQGAQGAQGPQGVQGAQGPQGNQGAQGAQGPQGTQGVQGAQGAQGSAGTNGTNGTKGGVPYTFSTTITDADPGNGVIRYNNATIGSVSTIFIDNNDSNSNVQTTWYDTWDDSTNTQKGYLVISGASSTSTVVNVWSVTAVTVASGYYKITVSHISGSLPTNGEALSLEFSRTGNVGAQGSAGPSTTINATNDTSTTTLYPVMVGATGSDQTAKARSTATALSFNASTNTLSLANLSTVGTITLTQNPNSIGYGTTIAIPPYYIGQTMGDNDAWKIYGESPSGTNTGYMVFEVNDDVENSERFLFRTRRTYTSVGGTSLFELTQNGNIMQYVPLLVGTASSTGTVSQPLQVTGGAYVSGNVGVGVTNPTYKLHTIGNIKASTSLHFGSGGTYEAGTLYSDGNWGVILRAFQSSPAIADFLFTNSADTQRLKIDNSGNVIIPGSNSATGTASQLLQVTGGAYVSGNVGIGTTRPLQNLHVQGNLLVSAGSSTGQHITQKAYELNSGTLSWEGSAGQLFSITNNLTSGSIFSVNDVSGIPSIDVDANGTIELGPYGGNIGLGTTNPTSKLHVIGDTVISGIITCRDLNSTSDVNLKENIQSIENPIDIVNDLRGVRFEWKENHNPSFGVIAQELEQVLPELVNGDNPKTVNYNGLIGVLIEAVKEQQKQINELKTVINNLI